MLAAGEHRTTVSEIAAADDASLGSRAAVETGARVVQVVEMARRRGRVVLA